MDKKIIIFTVTMLFCIMNTGFTVGTLISVTIGWLLAEHFIMTAKK